MSVYDHFRAEEKPLVEKTEDWVARVVNRHEWIRTDFLDPRQQFVVQAIAKQQSAVQVQFDSHCTGCERQRSIICQSYFFPDETDFGHCLLNIETVSGQRNIEHRDVLGALLGSGIKRDKIGDILITEGQIQCMVATEIAPFIQLHVNEIGRSTVRLEPIGLEGIRIPSADWTMKYATASSMRLDVILAELLPLSRSKILPLIKNGKVKLNWRTITKTSELLQEGDQLSVRGFGRFVVDEIEGMTKKNKYKLRLGKKS